MTIVTKRRGGKEIPCGEIDQYRRECPERGTQDNRPRAEIFDAARALFAKPVDEAHSRITPANSSY